MAVLVLALAAPGPAAAAPGSAAGAAAADVGGCFEAHVKEAIAANTARRPVYAALSGGASEALSDRLIATERATAAIAVAFDRSARPYQRAGIPVMCDEFVSMEGAGAPVATEPRALPSDLDALLDALADGDRLERAWRSGGFPAVAEEADAMLRAADGVPDHLCMTRHMLESVRRAAGLATRHEAAAWAAGFRLRSPARLSRAFVRMQVEALPLAADLDRDAAPLQARGIPILCRDLPPIPPR